MLAPRPRIGRIATGRRLGGCRIDRCEARKADSEGSKCKPREDHGSSPLKRMAYAASRVLAVVAGNRHVDQRARLGMRGEPHRRELLGAAHVVLLREHAAFCADFCPEMTPQRRLPILAQQPRALLAQAMRHLRHARGRRAGPLRVREHVQVRQPALGDELARARKRIVGLGREARDDIGAEHHIGAQPPHLARERDRVGAQMPALHALQDQVVAMLQRKMQVRHQPRLVRDRVEQVRVGFDRVDRRDAQPRELRHVLENLLHQLAEPRRAGQARAVARDVDAGQHHLAVAALDEAAHLRDDLAHRHRARVPAPERDDAEGAAVVAAVLHLHDRACAAFDTIHEIGGGFLHRHDVVDAALLLGSEHERCCSKNIALLGPELRPDLAIIAGHEGNFGHVREGCGSVCAAQPVTTICASGRSRLRRRILCRACRTASAVTAQVLTTMAFSTPALVAAVRITSELVGVEPAAECDDVDAHATAANSAGSNRPSYSNATGPVIRT